MKKSIGVLLLAASGVMADTSMTEPNVDEVAEVLQALIKTPATEHPVGSCYGGGVVYYVNPDPNAPAGKRGLIVALTDANSGKALAWGPNLTTPLIRTSTLYFKGNINTVNILNRSTTDFPAATAANNYTTDGTCITCTAWYLPSQDELATLYYQSKNVVNFGNACDFTFPTNNYYWSSSQSSSTNAWSVYFNLGDVLIDILDNPSKVRTVRSF